MGTEQEAKGTIYNFFVCQSQKGKAAAGKRDPTTEFMDAVDIQITGKTSYGERVEPNLRAQVGIKDTLRRKMVTEVVSKTREKPTRTALEEAMIAALTDPKAQFSVLQVGFAGEKIKFDEIEIAISATLGLPKLLPFELTNIPLRETADEEAINAFVAALPVEEPPPVKSPLAFRTWRDATGAFSIEAKLLGVDGNVARLEKKSGEVIKVPVAKLSQADQDYLSVSSK